MRRGVAAFLLLDEQAEHEWAILAGPITGDSDIAPIVGADLFLILE